jgi:pimeloyl-ACP methyl ester carboxylesterase
MTTGRWFKMLLFALGASILLPLLGWSVVADAVLSRAAAPPAGDTGQFTTVDGVHTYYRRFGRGPALVLLHGLGSSHLTWTDVEDAFARRFTVYELDLPGFGYSDKPPGITSARQEASFVDRFLASLDVKHATVIGHSMGGDVAAWLAIDHPSRVERLVLVDAAEIGDAAAVFQLVATPIVGEVILMATTTPVTLPLMMADPYVQKQVLTADKTDQYARMYWSPGARPALVQLAQSYAADQSALLAAATEIHTRALIVWADHDPYFPIRVAETLHGLLPQAELVVIDDAGHLPQEEQPAAFNEAVLAWLARD